MRGVAWAAISVAAFALLVGMFFVKTTILPPVWCFFGIPAALVAYLAARTAIEEWGEK